MTRDEMIKLGAKLELARRHLYDFCKMMYPSFYKDERKYLKEFCEAVENFIRNEDKRFLIINMPPRHGKSLTDQCLTAWLLGRDPTCRVMTASYNEDVASVFSKNVRNTIQTEKIGERVVFSDMFPKTKVKYGDASAKKWTIDGQSQISYLATSPNGTATGFGCDYLICDDLIKSAEEAYNETALDNTYQWFVNTMLSRLEGQKKCIIVMTRWSPISDDVPVLTLDGWKIHGELTTNDYVFGIDGKPKKVKKVYDPVICDQEIDFGNEKIRCNENHLWYTQTHSKNSFVVKPTSYLKKQKSARYLPEIEALDFEVDDCLPIDPYWLGLWLGDGDSSAPRIRGGVKKYICMESTPYDYSYKEDERGTSRWYSYTNSGIRKNLVSLGLIKNKHIPEQYKTAKVADRLKLLAGLLDSDGDKCRANTRYASSNQTLMDDVIELVTGLGGSIGKKELVNKQGSIGINSTTRRADCYRISISGLSIPTIRLNNASFEKRRRPFGKITSVEGVTGRCIEVNSEDGLYLIGRTLIPTHNCKDLAGRIMEAFRDECEIIKYHVQDENGKMLCEDILSEKDMNLIKREMNVDIFEANYNQTPIDVKGRLYQEFKEWEKAPEGKILNYTDTADTGTDFLCSINYVIFEKEAYILDLYFSDEAMEITEPKVAELLHTGAVQECSIESNNGGRGFARNVERLLLDKYGSNRTIINTVPQTHNKESRILASSAWAQNHIYMPPNWKTRFPEFYKQVMSYQRKGKNAHDDAVDVLASIYEQTTSGMEVQILSDSELYGSRYNRSSVFER